MRVRSLLCVSFLIAAAPAVAQTSQTQNESQWDVFMKLYPARALAAREEGTVRFRVTLNSQGDVTGCEVTRSSGHPLLDQETCKLVTLNAVFKPDPSLGPSQTKTSEGLINWKLPGSNGQLPSPQPLATNTVAEKVVCKKTVRTGSLAGFERTCMTPTEWAKQSDESKQPWEEVQGRKGSTSGN